MSASLGILRNVSEKMFSSRVQGDDEPEILSMRNPMLSQRKQTKVFDVGSHVRTSRQHRQSRTKAQHLGAAMLTPPPSPMPAPPCPAPTRHPARARRRASRRSSSTLCR